MPSTHNAFSARNSPTLLVSYDLLKIQGTAVVLVYPIDILDDIINLGRRFLPENFLNKGFQSRDRHALGAVSILVVDVFQLGPDCTLDLNRKSLHRMDK